MQQNNTDSTIQILTDAQVDAIADQLSNNEFDSDSVLRLFLIKEFDVPYTYAFQAVKLRNEFLVNPLAKLNYVNGRLSVSY